MKALFSPGTSGRHDDDFLTVMQQHQLDVVIDIRLRNEGRYYRFASGKHIRALCETNEIAYRHETWFSPTAEKLGRFRAEHDWPAYEQAYWPRLSACRSFVFMPPVYHGAAGA